MNDGDTRPSRAAKIVENVGLAMAGLLVGAIVGCVVAGYLGWIHFEC